MLRLLPVVTALTLVAACNRPQESNVASPYGLEAATTGEATTLEVNAIDATAGDGPPQPAERATGPQMAYSFGLSYRLPAASIAKAQAAHLSMCDSLGTERCRVIFQSRSDLDGDYATATLKLQVEAARARQFADDMDKAVSSGGGRVGGRQMNAEDVSKQIIDVEARIKAKQALSDRLLEILKRRDAKVADLVEAERAYADVQEELEAARSAREEFGRRVRMSEITAEYQSLAPSGAAAGRPVAAAFSEAGRTFGLSVAALISFLVAGLPWFLLGGLIIWALRRLVRRWRARPTKRETPAADQ